MKGHKPNTNPKKDLIEQSFSTLTDDDILKLAQALQQKDNSTVTQLLSHSGMQFEERHYEPLLFTVPPTHIKVADKLPIEDGPVRALTLEAFNQQENISYTSGIHADRKLRDYFWQRQDYPKAAIHSINYLLSHPRNDLVVAPWVRAWAKDFFWPWMQHPYVPVKRYSFMKAF